MPDNHKTLILQSYRTENVAPWIHTCLESVKSWAADNRYQYEFIGDQLFEYAPQWLKQRCGHTLLPITDVARLYLLKERLAQPDIDRVVWIDADIIVFAPEYFRLHPTSDYALSREFWISISQSGTIQINKKINNSVMFFTRRQPVLDFLIFSAEEVIRHAPRGQITSLSAGTALLSRLSSVFPVNTVSGATTFSPQVVIDIIRGGGPALAALQGQLKQPIAAANLCSSLVDKKICGVVLRDKLMEKVIRLLLSSHGALVNMASRVSATPVNKNAVQ